MILFVKYNKDLLIKHNYKTIITNLCKIFYINIFSILVQLKLLSGIFLFDYYCLVC